MSIEFLEKTLEQQKTDQLAVKVQAKRAVALDILRGLAILGMILSSRIPWGTLPNWMYHAQNPAPTHSLNLSVKGITWVDLVFPMFLFSLGAAIPFWLNKKLEIKNSVFGIVKTIGSRGALLLIFAVFIYNIRPTVINTNPTIVTYLISLFGFLVLFFGFARIRFISVKIANNLRAAAFILMGFASAFMNNGTWYDFSKNDIIIVVLANMAVFGSALWIITRTKILYRVLFLFFLSALRLSHDTFGSAAHFLWNMHIQNLFSVYYLQYLFIVIPGTIVGDLYFQLLEDHGSFKEYRYNKKVYSIILSGILIYIGLVLTGLLTREVNLTLLLTIVAYTILNFLFYHVKNNNEIFIKNLLSISTFLILLGLLFEPFEGGIQKAKPTLSYYFVSSALSILFLIVCYIISDVLQKTKLISLLRDNGQNPMLAYAAGTSLITPVLAITYIDSILNYFAVTPWLGAFKGLIVTLFLAYVVSYFTRKKIFLRS